PAPSEALPETDAPPPDGAVLSAVASGATAALRATNDVQEVFTNTWSYSTIGLVYDPGRDYVRYAHESQSSAHRPTIYDVDQPAPHPVLGSIALSTVNAGWPWQIDNRDGAGYDFYEDTYFMPDYNGDLSYADDNIVEVTPNGIILNAWEMDDEVGSNDSHDGSEIDNIIDIAVVPGSPTRYFATAAYDDNVVYEIALIRTGVWWTPNSWHTIATCTVPGWEEDNDNLGIDYDAEHGVLYHSSWDTTTLVVTDLECTGGLPMRELAAFDCPGAGGYNSGVTYIEGSDPPQVWVTDFTSDQTTICTSPFGAYTPPPPGWDKIVSVVDPSGVGYSMLWEPDLEMTAQTSDTLVVVDVITATEALTLTESWDPNRLDLREWIIDPPVGEVVVDEAAGTMTFTAPPGPPEVVRVTKWFHVEPCDWITTTVEEVLEIGDAVFDVRPFTVRKIPPDLWIFSEYGDPGVAPGSVASFTLRYGNSGGYENAAMIRNVFPITAPFVYADPFPDRVSADRLRVEWDVDGLPGGWEDTIDVYVAIDPTAPISTEIMIEDWIYDHTGRQIEPPAVTLFHVYVDPPPPVAWIKLVNGVEWYPGISLTLQTSQTFEIVDIIIPDPFNTLILTEFWDPERLSLEFFVPLPLPYGTVIPGPNGLTWIIPPSVDPIPIELHKVFHVETCMWEETILWEELWMEDFTGDVYQVGSRPVLVNKLVPNLEITSVNNSGRDVYGGEFVSFTLTINNTGGFEDAYSVINRFPLPEAPFEWADPAPGAFNYADDSMTVTWIFTDGLEMDQSQQITVVVRIAGGLLPSTTIDIFDWVYDHTGAEQGVTQIQYHVPPPEWEKWVDAPQLLDPDGPLGRLWVAPDIGVPAWTSDTITVTEIITTHIPVDLVEHWVEEMEGPPDPGLPSPPGAPQRHLHLIGWTAESNQPGEWIPVAEEPGFLALRLRPLEPVETVFTVTKVFHVEPCTWTYTILWEELWAVDPGTWEPVEELERRPVFIDKPPVDLAIDSFFDVYHVIPGQRAIFELEYTNPITADREFGAVISNTFPITAPYAGSSLEPFRFGDDWVAWRIPVIEPGGSGVITVAVDIATHVPPSTTIEVWDGIYNHAGELEDDVWITFHVEPPGWVKWVNGVLWDEGLTIQTQTSHTITITDVIYVPDPAALGRAEGETVLEENWVSAELSLLDWEVTAGTITSNTAAGWMMWTLPVGEPGIYTITKLFHVEPCTWTETIIQEELWIPNVDRPWTRLVTITKQLPVLWIDNTRDPMVFAGQEATFTLTYGNRGGLESSGYVTNTFPPEAPFLSADPVPLPENIAPDGSWARWDFTDLAQDEERQITVTVAITDTAMAGDVITIYDYVYDHVNIEHDWTVITFTVQPPEPVWEKEIWIDGTPYGPADSPFPVPPGETITIVDRVWITNGALISFTLVEAWSVELALVDVELSAGSPLSGAGWLDWYGHDLAPNAWHAITKTFQITSTEWTTGTVTETLTVRYASPFAPVILEFPMGTRYIYLPLVLRDA
ncbi:MAG: hypothetical protein JXD18_09520, partial [Anaerolineae bacterium]|nr:hypothetical protein [Anaerolineae bacterium]